METWREKAIRILSLTIGDTLGETHEEVDCSIDISRGFGGGAAGASAGGQGSRVGVPDSSHGRQQAAIAREGFRGAVGDRRYRQELHHAAAGGSERPGRLVPERARASAARRYRWQSEQRICVRIVPSYERARASRVRRRAGSDAGILYT